MLFKKEKKGRGINKRYFKTRRSFTSPPFGLLYTAIPAFYVILIPGIGGYLREELRQLADTRNWYKIPNKPRDVLIY